MRALVFALLVACGSSNDTGGHCTLGNACEDYQADLPAHEKDCKQLTGTWAKGSCPSSNVVGTCTTDKNITRKYYKGGDNAFTVETATASCEHEFHGTWKAN